MNHPKNNLSTVLESLNIILSDFICLGTTLGTILHPMNIKETKKITFSIQKNFKSEIYVENQ